MKVAIAHWQNRISPVLDEAERFILIDVEDGREVHRESLRLAGRDPFGRTRELSELGVDVLLCGAVSLGLEKTLIAAGIRVLGFLAGELKSVIAAYLEGKLDDGRHQTSARRGKPSNLGAEMRKRLPVHDAGLRR
jgi:predicted Fe-Mo cluster-binding NifX family protein